MKKKMTARVEVARTAVLVHEGSVSELPTAPAALGKQLHAAIQEALGQLPRSAVDGAPPQVVIQVTAYRRHLDLTSLRVEGAFDMNYMTDLYRPAPEDIVAAASALTGEKVVIPEGVDVFEFEVDVP